MVETDDTKGSVRDSALASIDQAKPLWSWDGMISTETDVAFTPRARTLFQIPG